MKQEPEYLNEIVEVIGEEHRATLDEFNEKGFVVMKDSDFSELQAAWAQLPVLQQQLEGAVKMGMGFGGEGVVTKRG